MDPGYAYKQEAHFSEWLRNLQGKSVKTVDDIVIQQIVNMLGESPINYASIKQCLKSLRKVQHYKDVPTIYMIITGKTIPFQLTDDEEKTLTEQFMIKRKNENDCKRSYEVILSEICPSLVEKSETVEDQEKWERVNQQISEQQIFY